MSCYLGKFCQGHFCLNGFCVKCICFRKREISGEAEDRPHWSISKWYLWVFVRNHRGFLVATLHAALDYSFAKCMLTRMTLRSGFPHCLTNILFAFLNSISLKQLCCGSRHTVTAQSFVCKIWNCAKTKQQNIVLCCEVVKSYLHLYKPSMHSKHTAFSFPISVFTSTWLYTYVVNGWDTMRFTLLSFYSG